MPFRKKITWLLIFVLTAAGLYGQVTFTASASSEQVLLQGTVEVAFTLRNTSGKDFQPPDFQYFKVLSGPNQSTRTTRVNGRQSTEIAISYILKPTRTGVLTIGPASVTLSNGNKMYSKRLKIEVVEGASAEEAAQSPIAMLKARTSTTEAYPGQQVILDYLIYIRSDYFKEGHQITQRPDLSGFYYEELNWYRSSNEVIDGVQYTVLTMARLALFPQRTGTIEVDPLGIILDVQERSARNRFGLVPLKRQNLESDAIEIDVKPLPEGAPPSFTGAVGKFSFQASPNRYDVSTDDAITLTLNLQGDGDVKRVQIPPLTGVDTFEVFDPNIIAEEMRDNGQGSIAARKSIEYALTPRGPGNFKFPVEFTYFDVDSAAYVTLTEGPFLIEVAPGAGNKTQVELPDPAVVEEGPRPFKPSRKLYPRDQFFWGSPLFWGLSGFPLLLIGVGFVLRRRQEQLAQRDPAEERRKTARAVAQKRLATARQYLGQSEKARSFYESINQALLGYFRDKLQIPISELGPNKLRKHLEQYDFAPALIERTLKVTRTCEMALYGGMGNSEAMQETYQTTEQLLMDLEDHSQR